MGPKRRYDAPMRPVWIAIKDGRISRHAAKLECRCLQLRDEVVFEELIKKEIAWNLKSTAGWDMYPECLSRL